MAASPHLRPEPEKTASIPLASEAYNSAERTGSSHGEVVMENWKPQEGQQVEGKFRLLQQLGGTDHSVVFLTERSEEPKKAVIKLVPASNAEKQILHWKLGAKLPHPHLLRIFESGQCELNGHQLLYVVMEQAEEDLSQILPVRSLTAAETREMVLPVLDALSYLHGKGFVHGDIKPGNILAIADIVKLSSDSISAISEGVVKDGARTSTAYVPPEVAAGKISPASDIWSLGMTISEVLTLHRPVYDSAKKQDPVLPKELESPFSDIVKNCLPVDPAKRWTIAEIKSRLDQKSVTKPIQPKPVPRESVQPKLVQSKPAVRKPSKFLYLVPAAALIIILAYAMWPKGNSPAVATSEPSDVQVQEKPKPTPSTPANGPASRRATEAAKSTAVPPPAIAPNSANSMPAPSASSSSPDGAVLQKVLPQVPESARRTITGTIRVRVKASVDSAGNVTEATLDSPGPSAYFARLSQQAAEKWKFAPAQASSQWLLHFSFTSHSTDATPQQIKSH